MYFNIINIRLITLSKKCFFTVIFQKVSREICVFRQKERLLDLENLHLFQNLKFLDYFKIKRFTNCAESKICLYQALLIVFLEIRL